MFKSLTHKLKSCLVACIISNLRANSGVSEDNRILLTQIPELRKNNDYKEIIRILNKVVSDLSEEK